VECWNNDQFVKSRKSQKASCWTWFSISQNLCWIYFSTKYLRDPETSSGRQIGTFYEFIKIGI